MYILELFSGTKSIGKVAENLGWESISVDMLLDATHKVNILDFDYKKYDKDYFGLIWASPPCTSYSRLQNTWLGRARKDGKTFTKEIKEENMKQADLIVKRTLEIINYFNVEYWFIENPQTGELKNREVMKDIPFYDVDYCSYSDWGYKKPTRIWTNKKNWENLKCLGPNKCKNMIGNKHRTHLGGRKHCEDSETLTQQQMYRIPEGLIYSLFLD